MIVIFIFYVLRFGNVYEKGLLPCAQQLKTCEKVLFFLPIEGLLADLLLLKPEPPATAAIYLNGMAHF
jgi:hypothetical protein